MTSKFFFTMSKAAADQQRKDCMANDNMTVATQREVARAMAQWATEAAQRGGDWERFAFDAARAAQMQQRSADRRVRQMMK